MNVQVSWKHLQYGREKSLYAKLRPVLEDLTQKYKDFSDRTHLQEKEFYNYLSHAVKIDKLPAVAQLVSELNQTLNINYPLTLFMFQSPVANAMCLPRYSTILNEDEDQVKELIILVSQHFMNDLSHAEQLALLGHELGHLLYGHVHVPAKVILESEFELKDVKDVKNNVLRWMICTEVSCDIIGLLSCQRDCDAYNKTLLKFTTGLSAPVLQNHADDMVELVLEQFHELSSSMFDAVLTTHPLTPLRLKIIQSIANSNLIRHFGQTVDQQTLKTYKKEFDTIIDNEIRQIYPEIIPSVEEGLDKNLYMLCIAVALSDGQITSDELDAIQQILDVKAKTNETLLKKLKQDKRPTHIIVEGIVTQIARAVKQSNKPRIEIVGMLRKLLVVAASDGNVDKSELDTIYDFARAFGITKQELIFLLQQLNMV